MKLKGRREGVNMRVGRKEQKEECHNYVIISKIIKKIKKNPQEKKDQVTYYGRSIRITFDFSESLLKDHKYLPRILNPVNCQS